MERVPGIQWQGECLGLNVNGYMGVKNPWPWTFSLYQNFCIYWAVLAHTWYSCAHVGSCRVGNIS